MERSSPSPLPGVSHCESVALHAGRPIWRLTTEVSVPAGKSRVTLIDRSAPSDEPACTTIVDTVVEAEVLGTDGDADLAVLKVEVTPELLVPVELGNSANLQVGQTAIAIGNPYGYERTLTVGYISALGRVLRQESGFSLAEVIQTVYHDGYVDIRYRTSRARARALNGNVAAPRAG